MHDLMTRCKAIVHYKHFDKSLRKVAKIYGVSKSSLQRWVQKDPTIRKPRTNKVVKSEVETCIRRALAANPFQTMTSLADAIQRECGVKMSRSTAGRITRKVGYTRKNARRLVDARHNPEDILSFCRAYQAITGDIICIDEAGFYVGEQGRRGYAPRGVRLRVRSSRTLRRSKYTLIMAVSAQRVVHYQVLDHNCRMPSGKETTWDRDVNASRNIMTLFMLEILGRARPAEFCRPTNNRFGEAHLEAARASKASNPSKAEAAGVGTPQGVSHSDVLSSIPLLGVTSDGDLEVVTDGCPILG